MNDSEIWDNEDYWNLQVSKLALLDRELWTAMRKYAHYHGVDRNDREGGAKASFIERMCLRRLGIDSPETFSLQRYSLHLRRAFICGTEPPEPPIWKR